MSNNGIPGWGIPNPEHEEGRLLAEYRATQERTREAIAEAQQAKREAKRLDHEAWEALVEALAGVQAAVLDAEEKERIARQSWKDAQEK
jgi:hypothetical protein